MAMTLKYTLNVIQVRSKRCHETFYIHIQTYKICNHIKLQVYDMQENLIFSPSAQRQISGPQNTLKSDNLSKRRIHYAENTSNVQIIFI